MSVENFLNELQERSLLSERVLAKLREAAADPNRPLSARTLAKFLVQKNHLSDRQATDIINSLLISGVDVDRTGPPSTIITAKAQRGAVSESTDHNDAEEGSSIFGPSVASGSKKKTAVTPPDDDDDELTLVAIDDDEQLARTRQSEVIDANEEEPVLGVIGMWRLGGGAHPYFALALGETMLRVGQRYLAWNAFERAATMAGIAWPDPALQERFLAHCRRRQMAIEKLLPADEVAKLRPAFEAELAHGQQYQQKRQRYEQERIAQGASLDDPDFFKEFDAEHDSVATPPGDADWFTVHDPGMPAGVLMLLCAGLACLASALWPAGKVPEGAVADGPAEVPPS